MLVDGPLGGARNMARDHALAEGLREGCAALRLYAWDAPTLSFGRNEPALGRPDAEEARFQGMCVVRRPTGGRSVLHDRELTYAVALAARSLGGPRGAYARVNRALVRGMRALGVDAALALGDGGRALPPHAGPCFRAAAPGEVTVRGRKLVGSAQVRMGGVLLQHGSILLDAGDAGLPDGAVSLGQALGDVPPLAEVVTAVVEACRVELSGEWTDAPPALDPEREARLEARYASDDWTWRR